MESNHGDFLVFEVQVDNKQLENTKFSVSDNISSSIQVFFGVLFPHSMF